VKGFNENRGFSLTEVLITIAIVAILGAIAVPVYNGYISGSKRNEAKTNLHSLKLLLEQYYADNGQYCKKGDEPCNNKTYGYQENDTGTPSSETIKTGYLTDFKPKGATASKAVLYDYSISITTTTYTITASPASGRPAPAPSGNLTINEKGEKAGW
jgi:type IV pilus assembly protein PilE